MGGAGERDVPLRRMANFDTGSEGHGLWTRARKLAERTPVRRNRYADFLRAVSIGAVVFGHWLMAVPFATANGLAFTDMIHVAPASRWLTWVLQVMPVFFIVGGYANAASWDSALRSGRGYGAWAAARLRRLVGPVLPLLVVWAVMAAIARQLGVGPEMIALGSQSAFVPVWFLAVYIMVVAAVPASHWAWRRFGPATFWALALCAAIVDLIGFAGGLPLVRWANYAFIWLAVHQLGYLWRDGRLDGPAKALLWAAGGLFVLVFLVAVAGYPVSMISVPGEAVSNSRPPTVALLALGALHIGLLLAIERPTRRWLAGVRVWTATILVNRAIMTLYLWHVTAMVLVIGLSNLLGGLGLGLEPGSAAWWASRPIWLLTLLAATCLFLVVFTRFEGAARVGTDRCLPVWRAVGGAAIVCFGLSQLALGGIAGDGPLGLRLWVLLLTLGGVALVSLGGATRKVSDGA
jgi:hypothetical protein